MKQGFTTVGLATVGLATVGLATLWLMAGVPGTLTSYILLDRVAGLGADGEGWTSFTIASPTGEGLTNSLSFSRSRRCTLVDDFRIV